MIHGRNLIVSINDTAIAGAKSCSFDISQDFIPSCSPTEGRVMNKIPTTYDWSLSVDCLLPTSTEANNLIDKLITGTRVLLTFTDSSNQKRAGFAYVKSCSESGTVGSLATFKASFEADGALYKYAAVTLQKYSEGENVSISINSSGNVVYNFASSGNWLLMNSISNDKAKKIHIIGASRAFAIYQAQISQYRTWLSNQNVPSTSFVDGAGGGTKTIDILPNTQYTISCNAAITIFLLYGS